MHRRYAKSPAFFGIGLMNEPNADGVSLESLMEYYKEGYAIVRRYSPCAYVGFMPRIGRDVAEFRNFMTDPVHVSAPACIPAGSGFGLTGFGQPKEILVCQTKYNPCSVLC